MARKTLIGPRLRRLRKRHGLSQAELAGQLEISPSYLNLIEHNQRALTVPVLLKLGKVFGDEVHESLASDDQRLTTELSEVFGDMLFDGDGVTREEVDDAVQTSPVFARAVLKLYSAFRDQRERTRDLVERLDGDVDLASTPTRGPAEEVSEFIQQESNHFPSIEQAAEKWGDALGGGNLGSGLREALSSRFGVVTEVVTDDGTRAPMRRYDADTRRLQLSESLAPRSRNFQLAHQLGLLAHGDLFDGLVSELATPESRALGRIALANAFAGAVLMPYEPFLEAARAMRYDVERLGHRFRTSFEQVCHRLTTMRRPGAEGVPFHMIRVDIAGNISKRFSASGIEFARFGGACPRWNVFTSFLQPGFIQTQLSQMPDGKVFFCIARTVRREGGGYGRVQTRFALGLGCPVSHAPELVYADGVDLGNVAAAEPIGTTCRLCERIDCTQRAFPPMQQGFAVDENVRHASFFVTD